MLRGAWHSVGRTGRSTVARARTEYDRLASRRGRADLALFHDFEPSPAGGGHQFLRALRLELERRGLDVEPNRVSGGTPACLFNSFNFDFARLRRFAREECRLVHRVDGPIGAYRGFDDGTDARLVELNSDLANATVVQSRFSLEKHRELGLELRDPVVIPNAVDPAIFHAPAEREAAQGRKLRIVAASWSANPRKGAETLAWLDANLDWSRYELTFVGQTAERFDRIRTVGPVTSHEVADLFRAHDVYLAPSRDDPCSNALLEALACALPAVFLDSGGHPELVGSAGVSYRADEEVPEALERVTEDLDAYRAAITLPTIASVADRYLDVLGVVSEPAT